MLIKLKGFEIDSLEFKEGFLKGINRYLLDLFRYIFKSLRYITPKSIGKFCSLFLTFLVFYLIGLAIWMISANLLGL